MTYGAWQVVGEDYQGLRLGKTIGDAVRSLVRTRFRNNAAKAIEGIWTLDARTARNVVTQGNVSERTLTKAARSEGWAFWMALGEELFGESYREWEEQRLTKIIEEAARDLDRVRRLRPKGAAVAERSVSACQADVLASREDHELADGGEGRRGMRSPRRQAGGEQ